MLSFQWFDQAMYMYVPIDILNQTVPWSNPAIWRYARSVAFRTNLAAGVALFTATFEHRRTYVAIFNALRHIAVFILCKQYVKDMY
jgi:hypothetical protein